MKKLTYLLCGIMILATVSCSKDSSEEYGKKESYQTSVKVLVETANRRSAGNIEDVEGRESNISTVSILVFNGEDSDGGVLNAVLDDDNAVEVLNTTTGLRDFIVIANPPANTFTLDMTKSEAIAKVMTLLATQAPDALVMAGTLDGVTLERTDNPADNPVGIEIDRLVARVALKSVAVELDPITYPNGKFEITKVYMNNVNTAYNIAQNALSLVNYDETTNSGWGYELPTPSAEIDPENVPYFYVAANRIDVAEGADNEEEIWAKGTQLVIEGNFYADASLDDHDVVKYPIRINRAVQGTSIEGVSTGEKGKGISANTLYNLSVKITRKGGGGEDLYPAPCEVTVSVNPWLYVNQNIEF